VLADDTGVILDRRGGGQFLSAAHRAQLVEGANWAEDRRGTNAIGTALAERTEVSVQGRAHLHEANHGLVCYSLPIFDPRGDMRGVLDLTSHADAAAPLALAALRAAARRIEERWSLDLGQHLKPFESIVRHCTEPVALVDLAGRVRLMNEPMRELAGTDVRSFQHLTGMTLDVLARKVRRGDARSIGEGLLEMGAPLALDWIEDDQGRRSAALLTVPSRSLFDHRGDRLEAQNRSDWKPPAPPDAFAPLVGTDASLRDTIDRAEQLAPTELAIVLLADTGTGKELLARAIHDASPRANKPFVAVNCAGFTDSLLQSELFGYGDGAFTGARSGGKSGLIESADGGTLFLDEIADLPARAQASLLRFLESGTFYRVGENEPRRANVRLISATCRDLVEAVEEGDFRKDLFYRIKGVALTLPKLCERDDLEFLAERLLESMCAERGRVMPRLSSTARAALLRHDWPGNVRELKQALQVALAMCGNSMQIEAECLPPDVVNSRPVLASRNEQPAIDRETEAALAQANGNISEAARILGVARSTIYRRVKWGGNSAN
jgi:transcriptional regulator of acetoin/glycerol metabolism